VSRSADKGDGQLGPQTNHKDRKKEVVLRDGEVKFVSFGKIEE